MAWYDNLLQRGTNYFTGNNLTNMDPNVQNAMAQDALGTNNQLQNESFSDRRYEDMQGVHPRLALPTQTRNLNYNIHQDPPREWREDNEINYLDKYPRPHQTNMADVSGQVGEYGMRPGQGIMATDQAQKKGMFSNMLSKLKNIPTPIQMMKSAVRNPLDPQSPNFNPMLEGQLDTYGNYVGETGEDPLENQNLVSGFGTNDPTAQLRKRLQKLRMYDYKSKTKERKEAQILSAIKAQVAAENAGYQGTAGGNTGSGAFAKFDNTGKNYGPHTKSGGANVGNNMGMAQGSAKGSMPTGTAGRNPWGRADGGRIGYQGGELVEQETDFIEGPQGGEEFQETVVEGQDQPSREQLEALAMEIFQLPLEELDEQQLLVVYQEAMQGQPMEEAVQEDEIQYAAQGGLAGLL